MVAVQVSAEVLTSLNLCNVIVRFPSTFTSSFIKAVEACGSVLRVSTIYNSVLEISLNNNLHFVSGLLNFKIENECNLVIRAPLQEKSEKQKMISELATEMSLLSVEQSLAEILVGHNLLITCSNCNHILSDNVIFNKVLPLPSNGEWDQSVDGWFCHAEENQIRRLKSDSNKPEKNHCFYSEMIYWLHRNSFVSVYESNDKKISCISCNENIGELASCSGTDCVKVWRDCVDLVNADTKALHYSMDPLKTLTSITDDAVTDEFSQNCRIALVASHGADIAHKSFLYMTVLNHKMTLFSSSEDSNNSLNQFFTLPQIYQDDNECSTFISKKSKLQPFMVFLGRHKVIKVLFKVIVGEDDETESWYNDNFVQMYQCSEKFFNYAQKLLQLSSMLNYNKSQTDELQVGIIYRK